MIWPIVFIYEKIGRDGAIILWQLQVKPGSEKPKRGKEIFYIK